MISHLVLSFSPVAAAAMEWNTVVDISFKNEGEYLSTYTDKEEFNALAASATYIRYTTDKMGTAVYKRKTCWGDVDMYDLFLNTWSVRGENIFQQDFDIFDSYEDALADQNAWNWCNGDDRGVGFPRDCASQKKTNFRWFAFPKNSVPDEVEFHQRFDKNYLSSRHKNYQHAKFEILVDSAPYCEGASTEAPTTTAAPTTQATTTTEATTEAPVQAAAAEPAFLGCFIDKADRDMPFGHRQNSWSHKDAVFKLGERETCFEKCSSNGYAYAGLQWKGECWCGNSYGKYGEADQSKCDCERGAENFGKWHQCIYSVNSSAVLFI
jgi:hypothetical protein